MNIYTDGTELRELRQTIGLSQSKLSEITGIVQARISAFELGKNHLLNEEKTLIKETIRNLDRRSIERLKRKRYRKHVQTGNTLATRPRRNYQVTRKNGEYLATLNDLEFNFSQSIYSSSPKALSFFAGAGGLCYGIRAAGFQIVGASEINEGFRSIHSLNFPQTRQLTDDVQLFTTNKCNEILEQEGEIDLMVGGPPCQGFSLAGKRDIHDKRNTLFADYLRIARDIRPRVVLMENVKLLTSMKDSNGNLVSKRVLAEFSKIGYKARFFCINAKNYGVPQHRERVVFIAIDKNCDKSISIPMITHDISTNIFGTTKPFYTFGDAVSDLEYLESGERSKTDYLHKAVAHPEHVIQWLVDVPEGHSAHENADPKMRPPSGYNTTYKRQIWNEPSATVSTTFGMISGSRNVHPIATRSITIREALRLQSFPDNFKLTGNLGTMRTSIGNAVPPLLAYALGKHILKSYIL